VTSNRRFHPIVVVVAGLGVLLFAVALILQGVTHTSIDPTEDTFAVVLHNDTAGTVVVKQCDASCDSFYDTDRLLPGDSVEVNTSSEGVANWWLVTAPDGSTLGCLPLRYDHKVTGSVVNVSGRTACPIEGSDPDTGVLGAIAWIALLMLIAGIGLASIAFAVIEAHGWLLARGLRGIPAVAMTLLAALAALVGGWLVFDLYVVIKVGWRFLRGRVVAAR
jgi:hypothetical protein